MQVLKTVEFRLLKSSRETKSSLRTDQVIRETEGKIAPLDWEKRAFYQDSSSKCISKPSVLAAKSCKANARDINVIPFVWGRNT